jgi:FkbH-like protein
MKSKLLLISDFNISAVARYISTDETKAGLIASESPYGQVYAALTKTYNKSGSDFAFIWSRPESISACFSEALKGYEIDEQGCIDEVTAFCETIKIFSQYFKNCFVASFTLSKDSIDYGLLDWKPGIGLSRLITVLNLKMSEILSDADNIYILDTNRWLLDAKADNLPKMWFAAKVPFHNNVYQCAAKNLLAAIETVNGLGRRIIFLDLDNTLWGGVVGENGWKGIRLGGHDHVGEAFVDFQHKLKALSLRGVQLAIVSKNEEAVALDAIDNHPDMVLKRSDFATWRINWNDKAQNIVDILSEINLGDYSAVFIDDNPVERDRVRSALPNLAVPEWPEDPSMFTRYLANLRYFDSASLSKEDRLRTQSYNANRERVRLKVDSMTNWLEQLGTTVTVSALDEFNLQRASQLFNKTNQLNLSTRRLSAKDLLDWSKSDNRSIVVCSVKDKFGDLGLTGIVSIEMQGSEAHLMDFILSCRVMGREVEEALIFIATELATKMSAGTIKIAYIETVRNIPTLSVLNNSALIKSDSYTFHWNCSLSYIQPSSVTIEYK